MELDSLGKQLLGFKEELASMVSEAVALKLSNQKKSSKEPVREYLTQKEVKGILKVSRQTLWRWGRDGILVPAKIGRMLRYCRADVDKALKFQSQ